MRIFITGIGGFAGIHLAEHLLATGHEVSGLVRDRPDRPSLRAVAERHPRFDVARLVRGEVTDVALLTRAIAAAAPDAIFHLAGIAFPPAAEADHEHAFAVNALGTVRLLEAARGAAPRARVIVAGSSDAYGAVTPAELPIGEETPLRPVNVYGLSKAAADMAAFRAWWSDGTPVIRARAFNHTGPGQRADFVCASFARQFASIEAGKQPPVLSVGNIEVIRDFSDVRDIVRGYASLCEHAVPGEAYNLCSGVGTSIATIVTMLRELTRVAVEVVEDRTRLRGREIPAIVGDGRCAATLGWTPAIPLAQTLRDLLDHWRRAVASESPDTPGGGR